MESKIMPVASFINLGGLRLERHVHTALELAWRLASGRPVSAAHLLGSAVQLARASGSKAFRKLASLLPLDTYSWQAAANVPPPDLAALPFAPGLARSYQIAESFLARGKTVWGRDYVTLGVLAVDDPSLADAVAEAGTSIDELRVAWLDYVKTDDRHRPPEEWERWWRAAGVSVSGVAEPASPTGEAYLLTWNPSLYPPSKIEPHAQQVSTSGSAEFGWSTGNRQSMAVGSRVFLLRQGKPGPRGLVGVGQTVGDVEEKQHWNEDKRAQGKTSRIVKVRWEALAVEPLIGLSSLVSLTDERQLWSSAAGGVTIDPGVLERLESEWPNAWARHKSGLGGVVVPDVEPRQLIARFNADKGAVRDSLNIEPYVSAFARVMASRELKPPLSIGLFGDWGTGKTYFMECLHDEIEALSSGERHDPDLYWPRICQVRFNAWHYAETDLWASLVNTIFDQLRKYLDGPDDKKKKDKKEHFNKLLNKLEIAKALRQEAEKAKEKAEKKLKAAEKRLAAAEKTLRELPPPEPISDGELRAILGESVFKAVDVSPADLAGLLKQAAEATDNPGLKKAADELEKGKKTVAEARELLEQTRIAASRAGFWWRILSSAKIHKTRGFWAWIVVLVAIPVALFVFGKWLPPVAGWAGVLAEALAVITPAVAWARSRLAEAAPVFDRLDALQASVEKRIQDAKEKDRLAYRRSRDEAEQREKQAREQLAAVRDQLEVARAEEEEARKAAEDATSQARLGSFVRDRAATADYEKYLGLITMIHRDFEMLSELMDDSRGEKPLPDVPRIDRIVLYIDDLDRCYPPEKVVRVLEAVHLLLFFPLFVVVVGVDSRWVSRSLNRHYRGMLADESFRARPGGNSLRRAPADSQDFLEKIFQVPFWLRRMHPTAVQDMIHGLITADEIELAEDLGLEAEPPPEDEVDDFGLPEARAGEEILPPESQLKMSRAAARRVTAEAEVQLAGGGEPEIPPTEGLRIGEAELEFMDAVAPLMPRTPRSVKRFVNIYRLYKAALLTKALGSFLGTPERPGNFRAVQVLLALVTGTPAFAKAVVNALETVEGPETRRLSNLVESLESLGEGEPDETWQTTLEALREFAQGDYDLELEALREVSPLVCRYSVHHMVSSQPGESTLG